MLIIMEFGPSCNYCWLPFQGCHSSFFKASHSDAIYEEVSINIYAEVDQLKESPITIISPLYSSISHTNCFKKRVKPLKSKKLCDEMQTVTFNNLEAGVWYNIGFRVLLHAL